MINSESKIVALFGNPVVHSLSPLMHNSVFIAMNLNFHYFPFCIDPAALNKAVDAIRVFGFSGVNVTIPFKVSIMQYLDKIDETANLIGAVNTVVNNKGILSGYNTDAPGFLKALKEKLNFTLKRKKVVIFGAGGGSKAIIYSLLKEGISEIVIFNRSNNHFSELAAMFEKIADSSTRIAMISKSDFSIQKLSDFDLIVNATSLGMSGCGELHLDLKTVKAGASFFDIVYKKRGVTKFIEEARKNGFQALDGLDMLIFQAGYAYQLWTGLTPPFELMKEALNGKDD